MINRVFFVDADFDDYKEWVGLPGSMLPDGHPRALREDAPC